MPTIRFPTLLKALRQSRELTQEHLAREIGVSFSTVNVWENGHRYPQPFLANRILELARAAGLDPEEFRVNEEYSEFARKSNRDRRESKGAKARKARRLR